MIKRFELTKEQVEYAIKSGEFNGDVISSSDTVVIILTQDWCPQWHDMSDWVYDIDISDSVDVYELIYNKVDKFKEFMRLKETKWNNDQIPYLRYYKNGKLYKETNYVSKDKFRAIIST